jgi:hypothetical protein
MTISGGKTGGASAPWPFLQAGQALFKESFAPLRDNLPWQIKPLADLLVRQSLGGKEDDLGTHDITIL